MGLSRRQMLKMGAASLAVPGGIFEYMREDPDGTVVDFHVQDVEPILKDNRRQMRDAEEGNKGYSPSRELRRVASIPNIIVEKWLREEGINVFNDDHMDAVRAKLDSPEYLYLRTAPGRVSRGRVRSHPTTFGRGKKHAPNDGKIVIARS